MVSNSQKRMSGGEGGIRTLGADKDTPVFKTGALNHYATPPIFTHKKKDLIS